jgi:CRP/FNR family cyclic AMP-dependent transcriptional regulator
MESLTQALAKHPFLKGFEPDHLHYLAESASEVHFDAGQYILREGGEANRCYLIQHGKVGLGTFIPGRGFTTVQTLSEGDLLGWSWLIPPYIWHLNAQAILPTDAIALDGTRLRERCEQDHDFGYELLKRLAEIIGKRFRITRMQLG